MDPHEPLPMVSLRSLARGGLHRLTHQDRDRSDTMSVISKSSSSSVLNRGAMVEAYRKKIAFREGSTHEEGVIHVQPGTHLMRLPHRTIAEKKRRNKERKEKRKVRTAIDPWWDAPVSLPGETCTKAQARLAKPETYTGVYRRRFEPHGMTAVSGDFYSDPRAAQTMLKSLSYQQLTMPKRAADFSAEVSWRMNLRPQSKARTTLRHRLQQQPLKALNSDHLHLPSLR